MKAKSKKQKKTKKVSLVERCIHVVALLFIVILPFSLLYIEARKLEIADQTEKTKIAISKEKSAMSEREIKVNSIAKPVKSDVSQKKGDTELSASSGDRA